MLDNADFYLNGEGLMVFTEAYHFKRGYCCKNKCKNCPWKYGQQKNKNNQKKK